MIRFSAIPVLVLVCLLQTSSIDGQIRPVDQEAHSYITDSQGPFAEANISSEDLKVSSEHISSVSGVRHVYYQQVKDGIDVLQGQASIHLSEDEVIYAHNRLVDLEGLTILSNNQVSALEAVERCAAHYNLPKVSQTEEISQNIGVSRLSTFKNPVYSREDIRTKLAYVLVEDELILSREVILDIPETHERWAAYVSLSDGSVILENSLFLECGFGDHEAHGESHTHKHEIAQCHHSNSDISSASYNVFAMPIMAPNQGQRSIVSDPWLLADVNGISPSPFGWHDLDGEEGADTHLTNGNNVYALEDRDGINNSVGMSPDGGEDLNFDYELDLDLGPSSYTDAATVNLFYMVNTIHDVMAHYGFDEAAGNFQESNYTDHGAENDAIRAESQDGSRQNNARFFPTVDGFAPRIEMYEWTPTTNDDFFKVTSSGGITTSYNFSGALFGATSADINEELVLAEPIIGCAGITNSSSLHGKIAVVERGGCSFDTKAKAVQDHGALAIVICNHNPGQNTFTMTGADTSVHIPAIMLTFEDCQTLKVDIADGSTAQLTLSNLNRSSDLDNGVITHEYGHGISQRLTGGSGVLCLRGKEQMGEGWSDYFSFMFQMKETDSPASPIGIGTYLSGEGPSEKGIRSYPYSTDMDINPFTYDSLKTGLSFPHGVGSVWGTMLWDMTWNLIEKHGFSDNIYNGEGGNGISMKLVTEGLKLQPCNPGFVDGRDAILKADSLLFQGANSCEIWRAFAKRGLGVGADQGNQDSLLDGVSSYDIPSGCPEEYVEPCTDESLEYTSTAIPDGTSRRVLTTITVDDSHVESSSQISLSASQSFSVMGEFEIRSSSELSVFAEECEE